TERLLGDDLRQHDMLVGVGQRQTQSIEARLVSRVGVAATRLIGRVGLVEALEHDRVVLHVVGFEIIGQIELGRGAGLHADRRAGKLERGIDARQLLGVDHEALAVIVVDAREVQTERGVAADRPGRVARQQIDFAGLQSRETLGRVGRHEGDLGGVIEDGGRDGAAEVGVEAGPLTLVVGRGKAGEAGVHAALERAACLHFVQRRGRRRAAGQGDRCRAQNSQYPFVHTQTLFCFSRARPGFRSRVEAAAAFRFDPEHAQALVRWLPSHSRRPSKAIILPRSSQNGAQRALRAGRDAECRFPARRRLRPLWTKKSTGCSGHIPLHIRRPQPMPRRPIIDCGADMSDDESRDWGINTRLAHSGHDPRASWGFVNPPVVHASTVLYPDYDTHANRNQRYLYGTHGTPTTDALCEALNRLEGAAGTVLAPSGLAAITVPLLGFVSAGDHLLIVDSVYFPTRRFADTMLTRLGVEVEYYDPLIGAGIAELIRPNTSVVFTESPGSGTFEIQDIPAIAREAHARGAIVMMDNTWATPLYFRALDHGVDVVIHAATKYMGGHSDVLFGTMSANEA